MAPTTGRGSRVRQKRKPEPGTHGLVLEELERPLTCSDLFGAEGPVELEIGTGKGTFLVAESTRRLETFFLGVEYARRYWLYAADRLRRNECGNARVVLGEAAELVRDYLVDDSLAAVHVYFPDPWPKKRHHKRRLIQPNFVNLLAAKMSKGARLQIATDHRGYFEHVQSVLDASPLEIVPFGATSSASPDEVVGSNFERKYRLQGRALYPVAARKPG